MKYAHQKLIRDYGLTILAAVAIALMIRYFVIEAYRIPTPAMRPTLEAGDTIFVAKSPFGFILRGEFPRRGDVVVFTSPSGLKVDFVKRVIGLPGDTVEVRNGQIILNNKPLAVEIAKNATCGKEKLPHGPQYGVCWEPPVLESFGPAKVPDQNVFVIGDLRVQPPKDPRKGQSWGMVPISLLKGKALWIWLSIEPKAAGASTRWFPHFRFERMFQRVN